MRSVAAQVRGVIARVLAAAERSLSIPNQPIANEQIIVDLRKPPFATTKLSHFGQKTVFLGKKTGIHRIKQSFSVKRPPAMPFE